MKKKTSNVMNLTTDELISRFVNSKANMKSSLLLVTVILCSFVIGSCIITRNMTEKSLSSAENGMITMLNTTAATANSKKDLISIPTGIVKANPFLPYRNVDGESTIPSSVPAFELIAPPETIDEGSDAARVMDTMVSGILYDKYSPSAILNIEGNDYLVKKGDVVNNYKILNIEQDSVTVKLGTNTFKAGIGEILTEGDVNINDVSNLNKKFGGVRK